jgi:RNA polymerase sigma factor (TIGR02999 family)
MDSVERGRVRHYLDFVFLCLFAFVESMWYNSPTSGEPMDKPMGDITQLLHQWREGSREAENQLFSLVLPNLRRLAHYLMQRERKDHSLQATELVDQVYFRMVAARERDWQNRKHFFAIAARAMRRHLIDHARGRPSAEFVGLEGLESVLPGDSGKLDVAIAVDRLLDEMAETKPEWSMLVEMKFFLGLTDEEAAEAMGVKLRTMQRTWSDARRWLYTHMEPGHAQSAG